MVLAPRLDLASDPKDAAGALGGFGEDSRLAGSLGAAYSRGLSRAGIAACIGRFPGLGSICSDCYEGMAFISLPVERLERCEMRPFARVVEAGAEAVFVGRASARTRKRKNSGLGERARHRRPPEGIAQVPGSRDRR